MVCGRADRSWDLEAITSYTGRSIFAARLAQGRSEFFTWGSYMVFPNAKSILAKPVVNSSRF